MNNIYIESDNKDFINVSILSNSQKKWVTVILLLMGVFSFIFPISILFFDNLEIGIGFILTILIFFGSSIFFFRKILWNIYGKEIYNIYANKLVYFYDYRLFKDNKKEVLFENNIEVGFISIDKPNLVCLTSKEEIDNESLCFLIFIINREIIKSNIPIPFKFVKELSVLLNKLNYTPASL